MCVASLIFLVSIFYSQNILRMSYDKFETNNYHNLFGFFEVTYPIYGRFL